jgi:purine-binding chemotaxis protein CheW
LVFRAGGYLCALDIERVVEIMRPLPVEPLAGTAPHLTGISVIRGEPVPVVDAAVLVGGEHTVTRYITVKAGPGPVALAVESVLGVRSIPLSGRHDPPPSLASGLVTGVGVLGTEPVLFLCTAGILTESTRTATRSQTRTPSR